MFFLLMVLKSSDEIVLATNPLSRQIWQKQKISMFFAISQVQEGRRLEMLIKLRVFSAMISFGV